MNKEALVNAAKLLRQFGEQIAEAKHISSENAEIIKALANTSIPIAKLIDKKAVAILGIDSDTLQPIVLSTISGESIAPCQPGDHACTAEPADIPDEIRNALQISQPMNGKVKKNGQTIPARFIVSVAAVYEGSTCITYYVNGVQYVYCY